jgi:hypothetical protein
MTTYIKATQTQMTKSQHAAYDRRVAKIRENVTPGQFSVIYTTDDQQYRVVRDANTGKFFCQHLEGKTWQWMREGIMYKKFTREGKAVAYVERFATPAELL